MYAMIKNEVEMDSGTTTNKQMKSVYGFGMETSMKNTYAWHSGVSDLGSAQRPAILSWEVLDISVTRNKCWHTTLRGINIASFLIIYEDESSFVCYDPYKIALHNTASILQTAHGGKEK